jgi:hypothetical protein
MIVLFVMGQLAYFYCCGTVLSNCVYCCWSFPVCVHCCEIVAPILFIVVRHLADFCSLYQRGARVGQASQFCSQ